MFFAGQVENRTLKAPRLREWIEQQKNGRYSIEIKRIRKLRSLDQNALYWMWLEVVSRDTGYDKEELHTTFRSMFLTDRSKKLPLIRSTARLNKNQFSIYLGKVERVASELGIALPQPEDNLKAMYEG